MNHDTCFRLSYYLCTMLLTSLPACFRICWKKMVLDASSCSPMPTAQAGIQELPPPSPDNHHPTLLTGNPWLHFYICRVSCGPGAFFRDVVRYLLGTLTADLREQQQMLSNPGWKCIVRVLRVPSPWLWTGPRRRN